ncbi:hypothetical protein GCM10028822_18380 [Hymenobacter terrigena]
MVALGLVLSALTARAGAVPEPRAAVNWAAFLARNDAVWNQLPTGWDDAVLLGNGLLGTTLFQEGTTGLHFEISRTDVYDHRTAYSTVVGRCRLPNGHFQLQYAGTNPTGTMRLDLWNAEARGTVKTSAGTIQVRSFVHATEKVLVVELLTTGRESQAAWQWRPDTAKTPVAAGIPADYVAYPQPQQSATDGINVSVQALPEGEAYKNAGQGAGQYATAWKVVDAGAGRRLIYISEGYSFPGTTAAQEAVASVKKALNAGMTPLEASHRAWWHSYYPKSFLTLPSAKVEGFYWMQMYKMAAATRADRPMIDLLGPWFTRTKWPAIWWNLNAQLAYAPFYAANHNDLANPLVNVLNEHRAVLTANSGFPDSYNIGRSSGLDLVRPVGPECADLTYALQNVWQQYRATMDEDLLRHKLFPLMKGSFAYFTHLMKTEADGKIHIPATGSPEYPGGEKADDANYTLSLVKWLARTLVYADDRLGLHDPARATWQQMVTNLVPYPADSTGFLVARNLPFAVSHRHWSHLFMIYPLYEYTYDNPAQVPLIERSLNNWLKRPEAFRGFSRAGAVSIYSMGGKGNDALKYLNILLDPAVRYPILPNTLYKEGGAVIETPLYGARAIQDMVLQSYNGIIRVFPAVPDAWPSLAFDKFRADGAFLVSAKREKGKTAFIKVQSLAGEVCRLKSDLVGPLKAVGSRAFTLKKLPNNVVEIDLKKGEWAVLYAGATPPAFTIDQVATVDKPNYWGRK